MHAVFLRVVLHSFSVLGDKPQEKGAPDLYIRSVVFSPDFRYLATGAEDRVVRVWDIKTQRVHQSFLGHQQEIYSLDWSRDGSLLVSGSGDRMCPSRSWLFNDICMV